MAWIRKQDRLTQAYIVTTSALNCCGVRPDGAEIKPWILEQVNDIDPPVSKFEIQMVLAGMIKEGVKFLGDVDSHERFAKNPIFEGLSLGA